MKTARKNHFHFADLPREYAALCRFHLPRPIHDKGEYEAVLEIAGAFAGFEDKMTADQADYFELLTTLLEAWEAAHDKWHNPTPLSLLKHLLEDHAMTASDLSRLLGASRQLGPMILRGERSITADHARAFGMHFGLPAGAFIE